MLEVANSYAEKNQLTVGTPEEVCFSVFERHFAPKKKVDKKKLETKKQKVTTKPITEGDLLEGAFGVTQEVIEITKENALEIKFLFRAADNPEAKKWDATLKKNEKGEIVLEPQFVGHTPS